MGTWKDIRPLDIRRGAYLRRKKPYQFRPEKMASLGEPGASYEEMVAFRSKHLVGMRVRRHFSQASCFINHWEGTRHRYNYPNI